MKDQHGQSVIFAGLTVKIETETNEVGEEEEGMQGTSGSSKPLSSQTSVRLIKEKEYKLPDVKENPHVIGCDAAIHDYTYRHTITITAGDRAAYSPQTDMFTCPYINRLTTSEHFYGTMFHECIDGTGPRLVPKSEITICRDDRVWSAIFQTRFQSSGENGPRKNFQPGKLQGRQSDEYLAGDSRIQNVLRHFSGPSTKCYPILLFLS